MGGAPAATVAVLLAAGAGKRFSGNEYKLLTVWRGRPLISWALQHALAAGLEETWLVTGAVDLASAGVLTGAGTGEIKLFVNPRWAEGQSTSVQVAVAAATPRTEISALVFGLGDQPLIPPSAWRAVAASTGRPIAVATYRGQRRNPVRISRECWHLLPSSGDEGARALMRERPDLVTTVPCDGDPADVDTNEDLSALE